MSLCSSSVRSAPSLTIHTGFLARYVLAAAIHPHGERSGHRALSIALLQKFHFWHFPKKKDRSRFYISSLKLFCPSPRHHGRAKPLPRFRGLLRPLYCITRGGYSSVQFGTVRYSSVQFGTTEKPRAMAGLLWVRGVYLFCDCAGDLSGVTCFTARYGVSRFVTPFPSVAGSTAGGAASMLAHRSAGASVFLLCSAGFTLTHPANAARCEWYFCLYCVRFVRRHEMNQHPASLLSLVKDF